MNMHGAKKKNYLMTKRRLKFPFKFFNPVELYTHNETTRN